MRYLAKFTALRWCLVAGHAHCTSMASRTAYSTWTPQKPTLFDGHYLSNRSTLDIGVLGYIGIVQHKEQFPEVLSIPPGTPCISVWRVVCGFAGSTEACLIVSCASNIR